MPKTIAIQQEGLLYIDEVTEKTKLMAYRLYGSVKKFNRKPLTIEERDELALSLTPEKGKKILRRFGL